MTSNTPDLMNELIRVLDSAAMYNDKGHVWSVHNFAKREAMQAEFHQKMLNLITQMGADALPPELLRAIESGAAARDEFGYFFDLAQRSR
jgi:hypothetical protein